MPLQRSTFNENTIDQQEVDNAANVFDCTIHDATSGHDNINNLISNLKSDKKYTYDPATNIIEQQDPTVIDKLKDVGEAIKNTSEIATEEAIKKGKNIIKSDKSKNNTSKQTETNDRTVKDKFKDVGETVKDTSKEAKNTTNEKTKELLTKTENALNSVGEKISSDKQ